MSIAPDVEPIVLGPHLNCVRMTAEEFDAILESDCEYDEDYCYELIDGMLVVNRYPLPAERGPNEYLGRLLLNYQEDHPQGTALDGTLQEEYIRTARGRRRADRVIWAALGRQPNHRQDLPTIVVEFVSYGRRDWRRDYVEKRNEYLALGIAEHWVFDRFQRSLTVYRGAGERHQEQTIGDDGIYQTDLLPGFELPVARVLKVADRWTEE